MKELCLALGTKPFVLLLESAISSWSFPQEFEGEEGIISTSDGTIWYLNLLEQSTIRL